MENKTFFKFHIDEKLFNQIRDVAGKGHVREFARKLADLVLPILTKNLGYEFCDASVYEVFKSAHDVKIEISHDNYKNLKIAHCEINTFSMGTIMRWLIRFALNIVKKVGIDKMWRVLKQQIIRFIKKKSNLQVAVKFEKIHKEMKVKGKKKKITIPKLNVLLLYDDLHGLFSSQELCF